MPHIARTFLALIVFVATAATSHAEVLIRWTVNQVPAPHVLGVPSVVIPAKHDGAVRNALTQGYRVHFELEAGNLATFRPPRSGFGGVLVRGGVTRAQVAALAQRLAPTNGRVRVADERGKWPHIRSNWVTRNNDVLQVAGRSAQPWIESNAAHIRIAASATPDVPPVLMFEWTPLTLSDADEGPAVENYLVAIAEAGSFGADLVLPLHERFQRRLLLGDPQARRDWAEIRRYLDFYADDIPSRYEPIAAIGVVTSTPAVWFEVMNLLARHNLPFELIAPSRLVESARAPLKLLIVLDEPDEAQTKVLAEFERNGGLVKVVKEASDPNRFALQMRQLLGRDDRVLEIWNGITVLAAPYKAAEGGTRLVTVINYAHQALPVQFRVAGTFSQVYYESPEEPALLLAHEHRNAHTEFVVPALRVGGRIFLRPGP